MAPAANTDLEDEEFLKFIGSTDEKPWIPGADLGNADMLPLESHRNVADFDANITDELCTQFLEAEPQIPGSDLLDVLDLERSLRASTIEEESDGTPKPRHGNLRRSQPYVKLEDVCPCTLQGHICMHHGR